MENTYQHWLLEKRENIAYLTLNRPAKKNRIDDTTLSELGEITDILATDSSIWVIILQANGANFSAGVDVSLIGNMVGQDKVSYQENLKKAQSFF